MDELRENPIHRPLRRRKTRWEIFKENSLPVLILLAAVVVILLLIIGAISRNAEAAQAICHRIAML